MTNELSYTGPSQRSSAYSGSTPSNSRYNRRCRCRCARGAGPVGWRGGRVGHGLQQSVGSSFFAR